jgi:hypothetical protein
VNAGEMTALQCTVIKGDSPISIIWLFNQTEISSNDGVLIRKMGSRISSLSIESVRADHSGAYTCLARNAAGVNNHTAYLHVNGNFIQLYNFYVIVRTLLFIPFFP